jgi:hypothetical protein
VRTRPHLFSSASHDGKMSLIFPQVRASGRQGCVVWVWLLRLGPLTGHWAHQSLRMTQLTALSPRKLNILSPIICHPHKSSGHCPAFPASFSLFNLLYCMQTETANGDPAASRIPPSGLWTRDSCTQPSSVAFCSLQSAVSLFRHLRDYRALTPLEIITSVYGDHSLTRFCPRVPSLRPLCILRLVITFGGRQGQTNTAVR